MRTSAGIMLFSENNVFLVHPGGPFFENKENQCWSIPKGIVDEGENLLQTALRELQEETGITLSYDESLYIDLGETKKKSIKTVRCFAIETGGQEKFINSNFFEMEWPYKSGRIQSFPECDKGDWFRIGEAYKKIVPYQLPLLDKIKQLITDFPI